MRFNYGIKGFCDCAIVKSRKKLVRMYGFCPFDNFRYGNSKEHMTVDELKLFLETEQKVIKKAIT